MAENRYTYKEIAELFRRGGVKIGTALSSEEERTLLNEIQRVVNAGAQHVEIASLGRQGGARTFGFSSSLISEIRRLRKFNGISYGVHASPHMNISGSDNNGFSAERRNQAIQEAKVAIDFAHVIKAGIVVLHPNSFPRPISDIELGILDMEVVVKTYYLVDPKTERIITGISEHDLVYIPQQAKDSRGNLMWLEDRDRKPILDSITGQPIPRLATDKNGRIRNEQITFAEYVRRMKKNNASLNDIIRGFLYLQRAGEINIAYLHLQEREKTLSEAQLRRDKLQDTLEYSNNLSRTLAPENRWTLERSVQDRLASHNIPVPADTRSVISLLGDELQSNQRIIEASRRALSIGWPQFSNILELFREMRLLERHGVEKISDTIAALGEYCVSISTSDNPIRLAIENIPQPGMYGSRVSELLEIINESRKKSSSLLQKKGYGKSASVRLSREFIGATLDIGHLNLFRQFYRGDAFHKWMLSQVKDLIKNDVIYNVHLSDNHGTDDSHLFLGEGNAPIKQVLKTLADAGYRGYIVVESGGARDYLRATSHAWNLLGVLPKSTDEELIRPFTPRQAFFGLERKKDDPERPFGGWL